MEKEKRIYMFELVMDEDKCDLKSIENWLHKIECKYLCVLHDKDNTRKHFHFFIKLSSARTFSDISSQLNIPSNMFEKCKKGWNNMLAYGFHLTDSCDEKEKYKYDKNAMISSRGIDIEDIFTNDIQIKLDKEHNKYIESLLLDYGNLKITKQTIIKELNANDYNRYDRMFKKMKEFRILQVKERDMQVVFINGASGSGKTTLAKFMATSCNYDYFVSGSGKDILDGYDKEECIILDDLRQDSFTKSELFKLTDNNTNSSVKSRFCNKDISTCKLMIITSILPPHRLYNWEDTQEESFKQLARRLQYVYTRIYNDGTLYEIHYNEYKCDNVSKIDDTMQAVKMDGLTMQDVYRALNIVRDFEKSTLKTIFGAVINEVKLKDKENSVSLLDLLETDDKPIF